MKKLTSSVMAAALACGFAASASAAACFGNCGTMGADGVVTASPIGGDYQYVSTYQGKAAGALDPGVGEYNGSTSAYNGSLYVSDSFSALAGDKLQFYFNYVTADSASPYSDYAWAALRPTACDDMRRGCGDDIILFTARAMKERDTVPGFGLPGLADGATLDSANTPIIPGAPTWSALGSGNGKCRADGCGYTDWIGMDYLFADAGMYSLVFGVVNAGYNSSWQSALAFDGITLIDGKPIDEQTVPEPATWTMLLASLGLAGVLRRRNKETLGA
jgi:hypothetical protein